MDKKRPISIWCSACHRLVIPVSVIFFIYSDIASTYYHCPRCHKCMMIDEWDKKRASKYSRARWKRMQNERD